MRYSSLTLSLLSAAVFLFPATASGQDEVEGVQKESYAIAFFAPYSPITALDLIENIPAFQITENNEGGRGLASSSENVIVNGQRIGSKSNSVLQYLEGLPAANVDRIDIVDAASLNIPGLNGKVANIITKSDKLDGTWRYGIAVEEGLKPQFANAEVTLSGQKRHVAYAITLGNVNTTSREDGEEYFRDSQGIFENRIEDVTRFNSNPKASLTLTRTPNDDAYSQLFTSFQQINNNFKNQETFEAAADKGRTGSSLITIGTDTDLIELGLQNKRKAFGGSLFTQYLFNDKDVLKFSKFSELTEDDGASSFDETVNESLSEHILKADYSPDTASGVEWTISAETAFNTLKNDTAVNFNGDLFSHDNIKVSEDRYDVRLSRKQNIGETIILDTSIAAELSRIKTDGRERTSNTYTRPKGRVQLTYNHRPNLKYRVEVLRDVEQLNFALFVEDNNFGDQILQAGGTTIVPPQFWKVELGVDANPTRAFSFSANTFYKRIEDPIDRIVFDDGRNGPGNLNRAEILGFNVTSTYKVSGGWLKDLKLDLSGGVNHSKIDDLVTQSTRTINDNMLWTYKVNIEHPLPQTSLSWGATLTHFQQDPFYFPDQSFKARFDRPFSELRLAHSQFFGKKLEFKLNNFLNKSVRLDREIYDGDRTGALSEFQRFERKRNLKFTATLSDTF